MINSSIWDILTPVGETVVGSPSVSPWCSRAHNVTQEHIMRLCMPRVSS